ncbi:MAG: DUF952 domain-containing protein [Parachlamydiaceae bacterium]
MKNVLFYFICFLLPFFGVVKAYDIGVSLSDEIETFPKQKEKMMQDRSFIPQYLYKIVSPEDWEASRLKNEVVISQIDTDFIHLATENQIPHVAEKFWNGKPYTILKLDSKKLRGRLVYETNPGGNTQYYHLYEGRIPLDAVVTIKPLK